MRPCKLVFIAALALACSAPAPAGPIVPPAQVDPEPAEVRVDEPTASVVRVPPKLSPIALRHGPMQLVPLSSTLLVDDAPWTLTATGLVAPEATTGDDEIDGEPSSRQFEDFVVSPDGRAFLQTSTMHYRSGWLDAHVYERVDGRWVPIAIPRTGSIISYYRSLLVRDGAVLGLWTHQVDPDAANLGLTLESVAGDRTLARGFVLLAGPAGAQVPRIPDGREILAATVGSDQTLYGLTRGADPDSAVGLLVWAPGALDAERVALPDAARLGRAGLRASHDVACVGGGIAEPSGEGNPLYLACGRGDSWARVAVELPNDSRMSSQAFVSEAIVSSEGDSWIVVHDPGNGWTSTLLRRDADAAWLEVPLSSSSLADEILAPWWTFVADEGWVELEVDEPERGSVVIEDLAWSAGRVWILLSLGPVTSTFTSDEVFDYRRVLLTVGEVEQPAIELPSLADERFEELARTAPKRICKADFAWIVLGEAGETPLHLERAQLNTLRGAIAEVVPTRWQLFEAELDGRRALLLQGPFEADGTRERIAARVAEALGVSAEPDCRPWRAIEFVENFGQ